ncbi:MAG TPA: phosphohistidine phosphatase SixA [Candidatus Dormibacteraeota bacterium]|nr:phosphohistidine phosphatase SixA [Candidatus Dormibacteraeota bacterium]
MNIFVLRHGTAAERNPHRYPNDADRPLVEEGERKTRKAAKAMKALDVSFGKILSSPYKRARQTAEIVAEGRGCSEGMELCDALSPEGDSRGVVAAIKRIHPVPKEILLVGHEPNLSELISFLISGNAGASVLMKKGGLCKLNCHSLHAGPCATLEWLLTSKQLSLIAD